MSLKSPKILAIRLDKIGDLVSTLPVDAAFTEGSVAGFPGAKPTVVWVIAKGLGFLPEHSEPRRDFHEITLDGAGRARLREILRDEKPDMTVLFYGPWWAAFEAYRAGVPQRVGRRSQWWSYLFLNRGLRQSRSLSAKHEAQYNFELAAFAGAGAADVAPSLKLKAPLLRQLFEKFGLRRGSYVVVHPGMAGSALNWPIPHYIELIRALLAREPKTQILVTGTKMDRAWTDPVLAAFPQDPRVVSAVDAANLRELLFLLENARAVVVPSTGVAHLAASLGAPTRAIYSPVRAHSSKRWGPRGPDVQIFEPSTPGEDPSLMATISVAQVLASIPLGTDAG